MNNQNIKGDDPEYENPWFNNNTNNVHQIDMLPAPLQV